MFLVTRTSDPRDIFVNLSDLSDKQPAQLSFGEAQTVYDNPNPSSSIMVHGDIRVHAVRDLLLCTLTSVPTKVLSYLLRELPMSPLVSISAWHRSSIKCPH